MGNIQKLERLLTLNSMLLEKLQKITLEIVKYAEEHHIDFPHDIHAIWKDVDSITKQIKSPTKIDKFCPICHKLNQENAEYCCYCGSSLIISQISPDLLHDKNKDSNHPKSYSTCWS